MIACPTIDVVGKETGQPFNRLDRATEMRGFRRSCLVMVQVVSSNIVWINDTLVSDTNEDTVKTVDQEAVFTSKGIWETSTHPTTTSSSLVYEVSYRLIGYGRYGFVHEAVEIPSRKVVAIKKLIIQLLQGHPDIPAIYAYGRLPQFDYMAMEFLEKTSVRVTEHMLSGFILRFLEDPTQAVFIAFGLTGPVLFEPEKHRNVKKVWMSGAADWASISAHHGLGMLYNSFIFLMRLSCTRMGLGLRHDLESLAYTVCFVLNPRLP
ncbi:hypothetical protein Agabi119p4_10719 [Agaricus bisporus var. burnettii]|uniref:Protein kinase domain-containing protein n=1 Tax=Agaricus bisporus var. burnettii TaxID=192524 RepID=A0A8H7C3G9_AGABI|nr:hypothetical protein Agabi119p4_10719 [Agaricus bisporus var. burnettii]